MRQHLSPGGGGVASVTLSRLTLVGACMGRISNLITYVSNINDLRVIYGG
jgi:hypothetical protein